MILSIIWCHSYKLTNLKNNHGEVFFMFFKFTFYKYYQMAQRISFSPVHFRITMGRNGFINYFKENLTPKRTGALECNVQWKVKDKHVITVASF